MRLDVFGIADRDALVGLARAIGGKWEKDPYGSLFTLKQEVRRGVVVELTTSREAVCEQVVVGEETVEVPDPELVAEVPTVTITRPVTEWRCPDSLLGPVAA